MTTFSFFQSHCQYLTATFLPPKSLYGHHTVYNLVGNLKFSTNRDDYRFYNNNTFFCDCCNIFRMVKELQKFLSFHVEHAVYRGDNEGCFKVFF